MGKGKFRQQAIPRDKTSVRSGAWDDLAKLHDSLKGYAVLPTGVSSLLRNKEAVGRIVDKSLLASRASTLASDCRTMAEELVTINAAHHNRFGEPKNDTEHMQCLDIHSKYMDWAERFESVVYPTYSAILQQFGELEGVGDIAAAIGKTKFFQSAPVEPEQSLEEAQTNDSDQTNIEGQNTHD